jgi:hypothetical protein
MLFLPRGILPSISERLQRRRDVGPVEKGAVQAVSQAEPGTKVAVQQ